MKLGMEAENSIPGIHFLKSNMAAKIQDGRHIFKFSEYWGISAVVIPRIV
jgi:hypothetical protein